jgi:hypothetical protein
LISDTRWQNVPNLQGIPVATQERREAVRSHAERGNEGDCPMRWIFVTVVAFVPTCALAQTPGNLLRNGEFQDDWITMLPETKNHHWCFSSEFYNRRDYNPDGWYCKGSWDWLNADGPWGTRRMVVNGPAHLSQRVNWLAIHDDRQLEGFPDAGGFPVMKSAAMVRPDRVVRDLTFRVKLGGGDLPKDAGFLEIAIGPPGGTATSDPMGTSTSPIARASLMLPMGTFAPRWFEVKLRAADVLKAMTAKSGKDQTPALIAVAIHYTAKTGKLDIDRAELLAAPSDAPNLLANGGFETVDAKGYPTGWSQPVKYTYFPPRHYYIFNTWHNTNFPNRGITEIDKLIPHSGKHSLRMIVPPGDETAVVSDPITLNQKEPRLIEVTAWIMTDRLCMLQIDGHDEKGQRLDGFNFIHKAPVSIGTDKWRLIRQVFRPRTPVKSLRLTLAARGVNGYTLDDTSTQPQNNVVGTIWWDDVKVYEPEALATDLQQRGVKPVVEAEVKSGPRIVELDVGERLAGRNKLTAVVFNPGPRRQMTLALDSVAKTIDVPANAEMVLSIPYEEQRNWKLYLSWQDGGNETRQTLASEIWMAGWSTPIKLDLGALYLRPEQKQFVRMNLGFSSEVMADLKSVRLEVIHRPTRNVVKTVEVEATPQALLAQRARIPTDLRDDFANLLLADLDVSALPVQPFARPERSWNVTATVIRKNGQTKAIVDSQPFCRLAHDTPQPPIKDVAIKNGMVHVNGQPWMPFGVCYGHTPVYDGPADPGPGKYRDLHNLPGWSMYDRHNSNSSTRKQYDFNCMRYVAGSITPFDVLNKRWTGDNLYCSSAFAIPTPAMSLDAVFKQAGGQAKLDAYLEQCRTSPMVVSIAPGIEEAFGLFQGASPAELKGLEQVVDYVRKKSGRPVMVGHGGYWNRLEFEKVPFFDIYDPETEPLYPANIHTDWAPLIAPVANAPGSPKQKVLWLRPQMYESIPYERWRFHTYVELMRGCRGWQIAHGPGDASLFRGLHGELEFWKPIVATAPPSPSGRGAGGEGAPPKVRIEPWIEHKAWKHQGKAYIVAATTRGIPFGRWTATDAGTRATEGSNELRDETNAYGIGAVPESGFPTHGVQYLPDARVWPKRAWLEVGVKIDPQAPPKGLAVLVKGDGRWTHAASWGKIDLAPLRADAKTSYWFLNTFYRHAKGFLGWGTDLVPKSLEYIPAKAKDLGAVPKAGESTTLNVPLDDIGAAGKLIDGVGFLHDGGKVEWGKATLFSKDGTDQVLWGKSLELEAPRLAKTRIYVDGLKAGTRIRVLFEDRDLVAQDGYFEDDFRGADLYQRYGGTTGYGNAPVALHLYEVP